MEDLIPLDTITALVAGKPYLQYALDLLLKSSLIIVISYLIATVFRRRISNNGAHLLWLNSLLCVAFLPLILTIADLFPAALVADGPIAVIAIDSGSVAAAASTAQTEGVLFGAGYGLVVSLLLLRLLFSGLSLRRIDGDAVDCKDESILQQLRLMRETLGLSRAVRLKFSENIASPMSFGLVRPVIVLPAAAAQWPGSRLEDSFLHELSHIQRLDWLTMLLCHVTASVLWINPLIWFAKNRVNEAAEQACDAAVLRCGRDGVGYAEDLLRLARASLESRQSPLLAQTMFDNSSLSLRIRNILDGGLTGKASRLFVATLLAGSLLTLSACSGVSLFGADNFERDILPTKAEPPMYPSRAAAEGIEGWALVRFTVTEEGRVAEDSIEVVDAEPAEIFDRSSIRAAANFEFQPRVRGGKAVAIEGVQYVFRYNLEPGGYEKEGQRPPPQARSRRE